MTSIGLRMLTGIDTGASSTPAPEAYSQRRTILMLVAGLSFIGGLIHVGAAVDHWAEFHLYTLVFSCIAVVQAGWAVTILRGASRGVLTLGCVFQLGVVALWAVSRTVGVPIAPQVWTPEEIGVADVIATAGEFATVLAVSSVLLRDRYPLARRACSAMVPLLLFMILVSALFGTGAHAG
jgi:hypothetical protein